MTAAVVRTQRLSRWYGEVVGLNDVTVEILPGITALLGPNGAGKSSFLRVVAGELRPSAGSALVFGEPPFANPSVHRRVGYCPEGDRFFDDLTSAAFLTHLLRISGWSSADARERSAGALAEVGMEAAAGKRLGALSKGMRQRVKLASAFANDPELLILDEPLSGLDPVARHRAGDLIRRRAEAGASVIVSTHVLAEVEALTSRVLLVHRGRIAAAGEVGEIRAVLDRQPHRIRVETTDPRRLAALVVDRTDVGSLRFEDRAVTVETSLPDDLYGLLPGLVLDHDLEVTGISSPDDRLQTVFDILTGGAS